MSTTSQNRSSFTPSVIYKDDRDDRTCTAVGLEGHRSSFVQPIGDA